MASEIHIRINDINETTYIDILIKNIDTGEEFPLESFENIMIAFDYGRRLSDVSGLHCKSFKQVITYQECSDIEVTNIK